jgi:hypothetical protein
VGTVVFSIEYLERKVVFGGSSFKFGFALYDGEK